MTPVQAAIFCSALGLSLPLHHVSCCDVCASAGAAGSNAAAIKAPNTIEQRDAGDLVPPMALSAAD
jgi:hypothetical protein